MSSALRLRNFRYLSTSAAAAAAGTPPSSISISKAKSRLRSEYDPDKALEIYSSVSKDYSSPISSRYAQEFTVRRLAKARRFSDVESLIESHKSDPKITEEPFLCTLIRSYGIAGMFDKAFTTFNQMDSLGTPRTVLSFNALLSACNQSKLYDKVPNLFVEIPEKYVLSPDKISYGILVKSYSEAGASEKAIETLNVMEEKNVEVTAVTFTTVLDTLYKKGKSEEAEKLWSERVKKGYELDVAAHNVRMMNAQCGDPEKVKELIEEMINAGLKPDTISYNYLMTSYCKSGMMEEAENVYRKLEENGCKPNAATFRTLISYLCRSGDYETGYTVFNVSVRWNKIPDFTTMKILVEGLVKAKKMEAAKGLIRRVKKKFPHNLLRAWSKVEQELGLASADTASASAEEK
ncbi:Tetratricopeptide repeat (TPR)-like superfamily protein [Tripterygium wilfordii]|uniref:Tetratricopeptide repeat (TPR)-like superfamily protein n=1 Tax=Tripterygium wilfordii TaxID=458696 RepID=A0A7J7CVM7_TRIWF|nr:pentatricopeptide repeat-containing protein At4g36680, mitochondrial-like [Tripterygium wilfordii]KAF5738172.1 Tetratricopeptide repeat (TPR)-like superfamily protein [Tripterygium wilfordii]